MIQLFAFIVALYAASQPAAAESASAQGPVVVELFTSQGCPMCPEANSLLEELGGDDDVIAIAYGVSYWDIYGWTDEFARPEFVNRQQAYVDSGEAIRVYTPHFVINGAPEKMRFSAALVRDTVQAAAPLPPVFHVADGAVSLDGEPRARPAQIWRVDYRPGSVSRSITSGANAGRVMEHYNMAVALEPLGDWSGGPLTLTLEPPADGLETAILVQDGRGGRLVGAARLAPGG